MIRRVVIAVLIAGGTTLLCMLLGLILTSLALPIAVLVGGFIATYAYVLGVLAGLWWFFTGQPAIPGG